jgi:hypothetical protein
MTEKEEQAYVEGGRSAWRAMLQQALKHLGRDSPEWTEKEWVLEREEAIAALRRACERAGDNDWSDDLNLSDIIEKHLLSQMD